MLKSQTNTYPGTGLAIDSKTDTISKDSVTTAKALQDVLFATNEDCDLFINEEPKGTVTKSQHKYIKLAPGRYVYKVKTKSIQDELKEIFIVKDGAPNEVFIDLLYFIDEKNQQRESLTNKQTADQQVVPNEKKAVAAKQEEKKPENSTEPQKAAIS